MRDLTFKRRTILSTWKKAGLFPLDPTIVLSKIIQISEPERPITPKTYTLNLLKTPQNIQEVDIFSSYISDRLSQAITNTVQLSPSVATIVEKRDKGSKILVLSRKLAEEELFKKAEAEKEKKRYRSRARYIQLYRTIYTGDTRLRTIARNEAEEAAIAAIEARKVAAIERKAIKEAAKAG